MSHLEITQKEQSKKIAGATGDLIGNIIADRIMEVSGASSQNNWEVVERETENMGFDRETPREKYITPWKNKIIDDLRLI